MQVIPDKREAARVEYIEGLAADAEHERIADIIDHELAQYAAYVEDRIDAGKSN